MSQENQTRAVLLAARFALEHPYAATFVLGGCVGSVATYKFLTFSPQSAQKDDVVSPKVYEVKVSPEDLQEMLKDPTTKLRWDLPQTSFVISSEEREKRPELPEIIEHPPISRSQ